MNHLLLYELIFLEWGYKTKWTRYELQEIEALRIKLILEDRYNVHNFVKALGNYGLLELLEVDDNLALQLAST